MNEVMTIDRLVEASERATLSVREKYGVLPGQVSATFARHAQELRKAGRSFGKFKEKEQFGKYLNILANFPMLKVAPLLALQEVTIVTVAHDHEKISCTAHLPLFGIASWNSSPFVVEMDTAGDDEMTIQFPPEDDNGGDGNDDENREDDSETPQSELPQQECYMRLLRGGFGSIAGQLYDHYQSWQLYQIMPKVPKKVTKIAREAETFGFTDLAMVWGPAEYTLKEVFSKKDPLLIGKMFNT